MLVARVTLFQVEHDLKRHFEHRFGCDDAHSACEHPLGAHLVGEIVERYRGRAAHGTVRHVRSDGLRRYRSPAAAIRF